MKLLITTSTLPAHKEDPVPDFVAQQAINLKGYNPACQIFIHAPHNHLSDTKNVAPRGCEDAYTEMRYHYFFPRKWEVLAGSGIMPSLKVNRFLYFLLPFFIIFHATSLYVLARRIRPDVIYAHWFTPQAINAAFVSKLLNIPFIFTTHASDVIVLKRIPLSKFLVRWVCRQAKLYTAVSTRTEEKLSCFFSDAEWISTYKHKLHILPMGLSEPKPSPVVFKRLRDEKGDSCVIEKSKNVVLFIGRLVEKKGIGNLIRAIAEISPADRERFSFILAGSGPEERELRNLADRMGVSRSINFVGFLSGSTKDAAFREADIVCIPSIVTPEGDEEGLPVVLLEALYYGKLIIASDVSGAKDLLIDGLNGFIFDSGSIDDLKNTILKVEKLPKTTRKTISSNAKKLGAQNTWRALAPRYNGLLCSVL